MALFSMTHNDPVPHLCCSLIPTPHGFFGRAGGISTLPHLASLNIGAFLGDEIETIKHNRNLLIGALGGDPAHGVWANQIHSDRVLTVTEENYLSLRCAECDGFVTAQKGITLIVKTADCTPILLCDPENGVIGALHAGWRGAVAQIAARGVEAMCRLGAEPQKITAAIGPCIRMCCYAIGDEVTEKIREICPDPTGIISERMTENGVQQYADIAQLNRFVLLSAGVKEEHIAVSDECTCCHPDRWFSHRASGGKRGVMGAAIRL